MRKHILGPLRDRFVDILSYQNILFLLATKYGGIVKSWLIAGGWPNELMIVLYDKVHDPELMKFCCKNLWKLDARQE